MQRAPAAVRDMATETEAGDAPVGSADVLERDPAKNRSAPRLFAERSVIVLSVGGFAFYLLFSLTDYAQYLSGNDLGIFDQAIRAYSHFDAPTVPVKAPGFDILGDHFHPLVAVLAPLYWLWDNPAMLLIAQAALVSLSIPFVYRFARRRASHRVALVLGGAYAFAWPVQSMVDYDFHEVAFAAPLLAWAIDALDRRATRSLVVASVLLLLVREDMGLLVAIIGGIAWARDRRRSDTWWSTLRGSVRHPGPLVVMFIIGGIVAFVVSTIVVIPAMSPYGNYHYWQFGGIGANVHDALRTIVTRPWHVVHVFFTPSVKATTLIALIAPVLWFPLRSPYVLLSAPLLAERFLNDRPQLWHMNYHYSLLPWLVLVMAFVDGAGKAGLFDPKPGPASRRAAIAWFVAVTAVLGVVRATEWPYSPVRRIASWDQGIVEARAAADRIVPTNVCVAASSWLIPHLTPRDYVTLPNLPLDGVDFIALDRTRPYISGYAPTDDVLRAAQARGYQVVFRQDGIIVLKSPFYDGPSKACEPLGNGKG